MKDQNNRLEDVMAEIRNDTFCVKCKTNMTKLAEDCNSVVAKLGLTMENGTFECTPCNSRIVTEIEEFRDERIEDIISEIRNDKFCYFCSKNVTEQEIEWSMTPGNSGYSEQKLIICINCQTGRAMAHAKTGVLI